MHERELRVTVSQAEQEAIHLLQRDMLEAVAVGTSLEDVLEVLCRRVEALAPELICTVLLVDSDGRVHPQAGPSMPDAYNAAIDGEQIGPKAGSCGTAAFRGEPVEVTDIANDPLWDDYRALVLPLGLAACWSSPIKGRDERVVGTFAIYYRECRSASDFHRAMVDACVHLCSIAIENDKARWTIHSLAFYDQLTGLPNRTLLKDRAGVALAGAVRNGEHLTVMFADVDRFKTINESLGHTIGDRFLQEVAKRVRAAVQAADTVCRFGGDEFVLLLPRVDGAHAADIAERLRMVLREPIKINGVVLSANASIGISVFPDDASDFDGLLKNAEVAMYQAKTAGRDCFRFFKSEMDEAARQRLQLESAIRGALVNGEFVVHYQPLVDLRSGALHGVEALVRWNHPQYGQVPPEQFIPLAEESGIIADIDAWVLEEACRQVVAWDRMGVAVPLVAVNVSVKEFQGDLVLRRVESALERYSLPGDRLVLEITESLMMMHVDRTQKSFSELRALGVRISVDDFGTGYSSLSYLKRFPVTELKLDRTFVNDLEHDRGDQALSTAVIRIGQSLGLTVIAEGVETAAQLDFLRSEQCHVAQGFYFSEALPGAELAAWIAHLGHSSSEPRENPANR